MLSVAIGWAAPAGAAAYPNDPYYARQWNLRRIGAPDAWKVTKGKGVTIAIVDTGIDRRHEDLAKNLSPLSLDAIHGDARADDLCPGFCHGTGVASVAAAVTNNRVGIAGVAPEAKLMSIRVFSSIAGAAGPDVASGVMWAADHGAKVINLSLGIGLPVDPLLQDMFELSMIRATAKGSLVVAAAGNSALPFCSSPAFNPAVLCVGATNSLDQPTGFSNYGVRIDVMAPGQGIWMATRAGYTSAAGTSFAAPMVSGVGALLMSMGATNVLAANIIRTSAKQLGLPGYNTTYGFGRVDAAAAVNLCKQICPIVAPLAQAAVR
jgi:subtilisin family serine protease